MDKKSKELQIIDLCPRLPYGFIIHRYSDNCDIVIESNSIDVFAHFLEYSEGEDFKPYLRHMSSMTEEEAKEIAILHGIKDILSVKVTSDYIDVIIDDGVCSTERRTIWYDEIVLSVKCFDFLTAHHFDYRGLIEKSLALEALPGMYDKH
jgi:hypothetical protein